MQGQACGSRSSEIGRWLVIASAAFLLLLVIGASRHGAEIPSVLIHTMAIAFFAAIIVDTFSLARAVQEHSQNQERLQQMATNIREVFWMIDVVSRRVLYVHEAYKSITGRSRQLYSRQELLGRTVHELVCGAT